MNVLGRFDGGDGWIGDSNGPGEWALVYHGTKSRSLRSITKTPLKTGPRNLYGKGIYCSPNPSEAEGYADVLDIQTDAGIRQYKFMIVCRVNVSNVHRCTAIPCPHAQDRNYTVHITSDPDIWIANCENDGYEHIRPYGILVKEVGR
jgi:hypothetical protein